LFEELFHAQESYQSTRHAKIFLAQPRSMSWDLLTLQLRQAAQSVRDFDEEALQRCLSNLLPEYASRAGADADVVPIKSKA
jgi:FlaA1/EpsC-like NDP-sugar epimerase